MIIFLLSILISGQNGLNSGDFPSATMNGSGLGGISGGAGSSFAGAYVPVEIPGADVTLVPNETGHPGFSQPILTSIEFDYGFYLPSEIVDIESVQLWLEDPYQQSSYPIEISSDFYDSTNYGDNIFRARAPVLACTECELHLEFIAQNEDMNYQSYHYRSDVSFYSLTQGTVVGNGIGNDSSLDLGDGHNFDGGASLSAGGGCSMNASSENLEVGLFLLILSFIGVIYLRNGWKASS